MVSLKLHPASEKMRTDLVPESGCTVCSKKPAAGERLVVLGGWALVVRGGWASGSPGGVLVAGCVCSTRCYEKLVSRK